MDREKKTTTSFNEERGRVFAAIHSENRNSSLAPSVSEVPGTAGFVAVVTWHRLTQVLTCKSSM
jgi:hypothetical protein